MSLGDWLPDRPQYMSHFQTNWIYSYMIHLGHKEMQLVNKGMILKFKYISEED